MKRIVYIATMVALLASSCQKTDVLNVVEDAIEFSTQVGKLTKADAKDYSDDKYATLKAQGFRVWTVADFTLGNDTDGAIYRGMNNLRVVYNTAWGYDPTQTSQKYFWPAANNYLYFYTLSAKNATWLNGVDYATHFKKENIATEGQPELIEVTKLELPPFTVIEADDDVMVADHIYQHKADPTNGKVVKPTFRHTMTKVEFNFKHGAQATGETAAAEAATVILKGVEIGGYTYKNKEVAPGLVNKGNLVVTYDFTVGDASADDDKHPFKWTPSDDDDDVEPFNKIPETIVLIAKPAGTKVEATVVESTDKVENPANDQLCMVHTKGEEVDTYTIYRFEEASSAWTAVETLNYNSDKKIWASEHYEAFLGLVLTGSMENFVTWYMIPQPLGVKTVRISYVADGKHLDQEFKLSGTTTTPITWEEEKCVKYNVTIAPHKIEFNPSVEGWKVYDSDSTTEGNQDINMNN